MLTWMKMGIIFMNFKTNEVVNRVKVLQSKYGAKLRNKGVNLWCRTPCD